MANSRLEELTGIIQKNTAELSSYIKSIGMPEPSFELNTPLGYPLTPAMVETRNSILDSLDELRALIEGPFMEFFDPTRSNDWVSLHAIYHYKIAESFPPGGETTYEEIAKTCGISESLARRVIRHAIARRIFREPRPGVIAHNASSKLLAENDEVKSYVGMATEEYWPAGPSVIDAVKKWGESQEPDETGFNLSHNTAKPAYLDITADPLRSVRFAKAMQLVQNAPGFAAHHVANNYPWASLGEIKIVDIGGSHGSILASIARKSPSIKCIVQDLPAVIENTPQEILDEFPGRFEFMAHDMFTEQPVKNADIYMFRFIFHNWSDKYCTKMLQHLIPALKKGAKVHIWDMALPGPGEAGAHEAHLKRSLDLVMLQLFNGKERESSDWRSLIEGTDPRFKVLGVNRYPLSELALIEAEWQG